VSKPGINQNMESGLVSVIVPTKNRAHLLEKAIESILIQTYSKIQILIIDDNSTDNTKEIVSCFNDSRIEYVSSHFSGRSHARNIGIARARGEFLSFLDDDDTYKSDKLFMQVEIARRNPQKRFFVGKSVLKDLNENELDDFGLQMSDFDELNRSFIPGTVMLPSLFIRYSNDQEIYFNSELDRFEDLDFYRRNLNNFETHFHSDIVSYVYTHRGNSLNESIASAIPREIAAYRKVVGNLDEKMREGFSRLYSYYGSALLNTYGSYWNGIFLLFRAMLLRPKKINRKHARLLLNVLKIGIKKGILFLSPHNSRIFGRLKFNMIYRFRLFGKSESASGPGSDPKETRVLKENLPAILKKFQVKKLADVPCGDFYWMQEIDLQGIKYTGFDIVNDLVKKNRIKYPRFDFEQLDITRQSFSPHDLVICRDLMVHLSFDQISQTIENIKASGSTFLLATTFPLLSENHDLGKGIWRPLNLEISPFYFGPPLYFLHEASTEHPRESDKGLGVWRIQEIKMDYN
jgi:glycosyltransferase involved in cell wall biosynthesis